MIERIAELALALVSTLVVGFALNVVWPGRERRKSTPADRRLEWFCIATIAVLEIGRYVHNSETRGLGELMMIYADCWMFDRWWAKRRDRKLAAASGSSLGDHAGPGSGARPSGEGSGSG